MSKINKKRNFGSHKIFDDLKVGKKDIGIKRRLNSSNILLRKNNKLMKGVSYGNDLNYRRYMAYLDRLREEEEINLNENLKEKNSKEYYNDLDKKDILSKKISFTEFSNKFKINPFILQYFDYYDIQKINRKETERNIKAENDKNKRIKLMKEKEKEYSDDIEEKCNDYKISNINHKTENISDDRYNNIYEKLMNKNFVKQRSFNNKKFKNINLSGIDFNLINKISAESLKVKKKLEHLKYIKELHREKERLYRKIHKALNDPNTKNKIINYNINGLIDEFTIFHGIEHKNIVKLNKLKSYLNKNIDENILPKKKQLSKTIYQNNPTYFIYIPNSAKYKHISFHKECLFNNEFNSNKKMKKKNKIALKKNNKKYSHKVNDVNNINNNNLNEYFLSTENNLKAKSNKIIKNLKEIQTLLKQDRNYTSKTIDRANAKYHQNEKIRQDQKLMERVMNDDRKRINKLKEIQKKRKNKKINEKNNVFSSLKLINDCYEKDKKVFSEMNFQFSRTLNAFCKNEMKENKQYKKILKNNYHLKLENEQVDNNIKAIKANIDNRQNLVNSLNAKIQKKCLEINEIINESHIKTEKAKF